MNKEKNMKCKTKLVVLVNSYHNTEIKVKARINGTFLHLSSYQVSKAKKNLCGIANCLCSNSLGTRDSDYVFEPDIDGGGKLFDRKSYPF